LIDEPVTCGKLIFLRAPCAAALARLVAVDVTATTLRMQQVIPAQRTIWTHDHTSTGQNSPGLGGRYTARLLVNWQGLPY